MSRLLSFLQRNTINQSKSLPLVHTTKARHLRSLFDNQKITASSCDVFLNENLNYFFVGRPAYKFAMSANAEAWELPICFVMSYDLQINTKRAFPFDSGGFRKGRMPSFIKDMEYSDFEVGSDPAATEKIIGTFFGSAKNYFSFKGIGADTFNSLHDLSLLDSEVRALHRLTSYKGPDFDDRQFSIEVQTEQDVDLDANTILALIVPSPYLDDEDFWDQVERKFGCEVLGYDCYPINPEAYTYGIYSRVESVFKAMGLL